MSGHAFVRAATDDDVTDIEHIVEGAYGPYVPRIGRRPAPMAVDYRRVVAHTDDAHVLVDDGVPVGVLIVVAQSDHLLIENVAVAPGLHGRGYGRTLMAHAEHCAREMGLPQTRLYTNAAMTENLALYRHLGYTEVDRRSEDGFQRVYFEKAVDPAR